MKIDPRDRPKIIFGLVVFGVLYQVFGLIYISQISGALLIVWGALLTLYGGFALLKAVFIGEKEAYNRQISLAFWTMIAGLVSIGIGIVLTYVIPILWVDF